MKISRTIIIVALFLTCRGLTVAQSDGDAVIQQMLAVEAKQKQALHDVVFDAEMLEGEFDDNGDFVTKAKFLKKIYIKYFEDTAWYHEDYLEYYKEGERQDSSETTKQARERKEKKRKRNAKDVSYPMLTPFYPENRETYEIKYVGLAPESIDGHTCHHFRVHALTEDDNLINGDYYVETEEFHLVRVDFSPAKLVKKLMFKLKNLDMSLHYAPISESLWLPTRFDLEGSGKAALFIGVKFATKEYYRNPVINGGIEDSIFDEDKMEEIEDGN